MASGTIKSVVPRSDIVNNLTTNDSTKVLSAAQGKALKDIADTLNSNINRGSIPENSDFNNYTLAQGSTDKHYVGNNLGSITNRPSSIASSENIPYALDVISLNGYTTQVLIAYGSVIRTFQRNQYYSSGTKWSSWDSFALYSNSTVKTASISTTTTANGNIQLPITYSQGVPVAVKLKTSNNKNCYTVLGRYGDNDTTGSWGAKVLDELSLQLLASTSVSGTLYYI